MERKRTPIPIPEREMRSYGSGPVITYKLSEEELAKYRAMPVPNAKKRTPFSDAAQSFTPEKQRERALKRYEDKVKLEPEKEAFLREIAAGKTIVQVERERGMSKNSMYYWVKKWDLIGITPGKARDILKGDESEMELSKEQYLEMRLNGQSRTAIQKQHFTNPPKFYAQLGEWGIKEKDAEDRELELLQAERKATAAPKQPTREEVEEMFRPEEKKDSNSTYEALKAFSDKNLKDEIDRLREELAKKIGEKNQYQEALGAAEERIDALENERKALQVDLKELKYAASTTHEHQTGMTMDQYQLLAARTANTDWDQISVRLIRNPEFLPLLNFSLGAAGEAGEIADEVKKVIFHGHQLDKDKLLKEVGDALWYLSQVARTIGYSFDTAAMRNIEKLKQRYPEGFSEEASQNREAEA